MVETTNAASELPASAMISAVDRLLQEADKHGYAMVGIFLSQTRDELIKLISEQ